jgi:hypothetical protein
MPVYIVVRWEFPDSKPEVFFSSFNVIDAKERLAQAQRISYHSELHAANMQDLGTLVVR